MFSSVRARLATLCLSILIPTFILFLVIYAQYAKSKEKIILTGKIVTDVQIMLIENNKAVHDFLENETINPYFFTTSNSSYFDYHLNLNKKTDSLIVQLLINEPNVEGASLRNLQINVGKFKFLTTKLKTQILKRGFKEFGIEGEMRRSAHDLENLQNELGLSNILQLRRHEKDFILRQEAEYRAKHNTLLQNLIAAIEKDKTIATTKQKLVIATLKDYEKGFASLAEIELAIGLKNQFGLKKEIDVAVENSRKLIAHLKSSLEIREKRKLAELNLFYFSVWFLFLILTTVGFLTITKRISNSITALREKVEEFVEVDFKRKTLFKVKDSKYEIDILANNISHMQTNMLLQLSALRRNNKELEQYTYIASHDLQEPLRAVSSFVELINVEYGDKMDKDLATYFSFINKSTVRMQKLVLGLLDYTRIGKKKELAFVNVETILAEVVEDLSLSIKEANVQLHIDALPQCFCYPVELRLLFQNLISNAIKFRDPKVPPMIQISVKYEDDHWEYAVSDNGIGIHENDIDKIFIIFKRLHNRNEFPGIGIGLSHCKKIAELHNGKIWVESQPGVGSVFKFTISNLSKHENQA
jgi:signal transduction histidine kinase